MSYGGGVNTKVDIFLFSALLEQSGQCQASAVLTVVSLKEEAKCTTQPVQKFWRTDNLLSLLAVEPRFLRPFSLYTGHYID